MSTIAPAACRLTGRLLPRAALSDSMTRAMFGLLELHFTGVDWPTFHADLDEKNWVIALEDEDGVLRGFSTLLVYSTAATGTPVTVAYSGDTAPSANLEELARDADVFLCEATLAAPEPPEEMECDQVRRPGEQRPADEGDRAVARVDEGEREHRERDRSAACRERTDDAAIAVR